MNAIEGIFNIKFLVKLFHLAFAPWKSVWHGQRLHSPEGCLPEVGRVGVTRAALRCKVSNRPLQQASVGAPYSDRSQVSIVFVQSV